eukprot:6171849-Pleurochrysis_carterae.AAC.3
MQPQVFYASVAGAKWKVDAAPVLRACGAVGRDNHRSVFAQASCDRHRCTRDAMHASASVTQPH